VQAGNAEKYGGKHTFQSKMHTGLHIAALVLLSVRAASPDIVTQVLTQLSSKPPQELWTLIHADAAAGGKPAKAAPAKAPAAAKGKAGELYHLNVTT